jgi:hypothetical protein
VPERTVRNEIALVEAGIAGLAALEAAGLSE